MICQECGGNNNSNLKVCQFCGAPLTSNEIPTSKRANDFEQEPRSEANVEDVTSFLSSTIKAGSNLLSGDPLSFIANAGKAASDFQNLKNDSKKEKNNGQEFTGSSKDETPYYMKPGSTGEPKDEASILREGQLGSIYGITNVPGKDKPILKRVPIGGGQDHLIANTKTPDPKKDQDPSDGVERTFHPSYPDLYSNTKIRNVDLSPYDVKPEEVLPEIKFQNLNLPDVRREKPQKSQVPQSVSLANHPLFINHNSLDQMAMSAFEVLPKETFGLLFGKISIGKVFISSVQPSQEVVSREEFSVQPDGKAINRLQNLKSRFSNTDLMGSYHSHVYLTDREIESISKGASPSETDLRNLLNSNWRNVLMIVGFFANEGWNLPLKESGWKREGARIFCNKRVKAFEYNFFHIIISAYIKKMDRISQIPVFLGSGNVQMEENRALCSICGGEVQGGVCKHCGSRLE